MSRVLIGLCLGLLCASAVFCEEPVTVSVCQLENDPAAYNHRLVKVTAIVMHGFEDFTLSDAACHSPTNVWLEYGGTVSSRTTYCCPGSPASSRPEPLVVDNIAIPLIADQTFRQFDRLLHPSRGDAMVKATVLGRLFAGQSRQTRMGVAWVGYGHMGAFTLLAIQQVLAVQPTAPKK
jgi:hypothetical protein